METLFSNFSIYSPPVKYNCFTCGGGIFGYAKNQIDKEQENQQTEQGSSAATAPTNDSYWDESMSRVDTDWAGSGTKTDPWLITSAAELAGLSYTIYNNTKSSYLTSSYYYYSGCYFKQTVNIDVSAYWWQPIGIQYNRSNTDVSRYFSGNYDGDGHTVSGVFTKNSAGNGYSNSGIFGYVYGRSGIDTIIDNIGVISSLIDSYSTSGGIVGYASRCTISYCYNTNEVYSSDGSNVGGIVGLTGYNTYIKDCFNIGYIKSIQNAGGIVGRTSSSTYITNCYNIGSVNCTDSNAGGIAGGGASLYIYNCFNLGSVSGNSFVGGIVGNPSSSSTMTNCFYGGNCTLIKGVGGSTTDNSVKDSNLISNAKSLSWYQESSKWSGSYPWDFDNVWTFQAGKNDGFPIFQNQLPKEFNLDVNGNLDGYYKTPTGAVNVEGYATYDVYINGTKVASQVTDFYQKVTYGSTYEIKNINLNYDKEFVGAYSDNACTIPSSLSGTMPAEYLIVCLKLRTKTWNDYAASSYASVKQRPSLRKWRRIAEVVI